MNIKYIFAKLKMSDPNGYILYNYINSCHSRNVKLYEWKKKISGCQVLAERRIVDYKEVIQRIFTVMKLFCMVLKC